MIYLKKFENHEAYSAATLTLPNVSLCEQENEVHYNPVDPYNGHEYVDLDLPSGLKWATCNVGASSPTEYGDYFMWGSTTPNTNDVCDWEHAPFNSGGSDFDRAYFDSIKDTVCPNSVLAPEYDAAHVILGGNWRMPTHDETVELFLYTNCDFVEDYQGSGVNGYVYTSKKDSSKSIFIPYAGLRMDSNVVGKGESMYLSLSTIQLFGPSYGWIDIFDAVNHIAMPQCYGFNLRGVIV